MPFVELQRVGHVAVACVLTEVILFSFHGGLLKVTAVNWQYDRVSVRERTRFVGRCNGS